MRTTFISLAAALLPLSIILFASACGGQQYEIVEDSTDAQGMGSVFKDMRRDESLGEGGWFRFTLDSVEHLTEWGYADIHPSLGDDTTRMVILNNPVGGGKFPLLRIVIFADVSDAAELEGLSIAGQSIVLKMDKKKGRGDEGKITITFGKVSTGWLEGTLAGEVTIEGSPHQIEGSFKVRLNTPE
ncbi:MAG TPA: hypothetical protein VMX35_15415 [Acidobacteriota bacterium]|nr:hypothetical protein [Acidobacteriota bacterium]